MIWALLAILGVPLWICAAALTVLVLRTSGLRRRPGNVAVRRRTPGTSRWRRGHAVWVHDVLAYRAAPASWSEALLWVSTAETRSPAPDEQRRLRRLGGAPVIATFTDEHSAVHEFAVADDVALDLLRPFAAVAIAEAWPARGGEA